MFDQSGSRLCLTWGFVGSYVLMINPEGKVVSRWHASNITYRTMKFFYVGRCWVMV